MDQRIGYVTSRDGTRIAYAVMGSGPPLVRVGTWMSHVGFDHERSPWSPWWRELSRYHTFIRFDMRGVGLSDRDPKDTSLGARLTDLESVVDALGLDTFDLVGHSTGAPGAVDYVVKHPGRVGKLVLVNGLSREKMTNVLGPTIEARRALVRSSWEQDATRRMWATWLVPDGTPAHLDQIAGLLLACSTGEGVERLGRGGYGPGLRDRWPEVSVPTLVIHSVGNEVAPVEHARIVAGLIRNARLVELESRNHIILEGEPAWPRFLDEVHAFLSPERAAAVPAFDLARAMGEGLTEREAQVLAGICDGSTDGDIASDLGLSARTVSNHVKGMLRRTGARNRAHAVAWAARHRLLLPEI